MDFPKHYSLVNDHEKHFEIHDARDNKVFKVEKKSLHPANQIKIMKLQKFDDGGDVQQVATATNPAQDSAGPTVTDLPPDNTPQPQDIGPRPASLQAAPQAPGVPTVGGQPVPGKTQDVMNQFLENQKLEEKGLLGKGSALSEEGIRNAHVYEDANRKIENYLEDSNEAADAVSRQNETLAQEVAKTNIDPRNYFHNMSTGQRIGNAIALIVGGIGAGLTHGPNMALQAMNNAIERDMEAQKMNLGKKQSLLSLNMQRFKDIRAAQTATLMQMNAMTQGLVAANSAKYGGLAGAAGTQALLGQMKNQNLEQALNLKNQVFQLGLQEHLASGDVSKDNPLDYVRWVVPADKQPEVAKELGQADYATRNHDRMMKLWDEANSEQKFYKTGFGLLREGPAMKELRLMGSPLIHDQVGRVNEFEQKNYEGVLPGNAQFKGTQETLRKGFEDFILGKQNAPLAKTYGIDLNRFNATKMNPSSPPVERAIVSGPNQGKVGLFDPNTKQFLGYKK